MKRSVIHHIYSELNSNASSNRGCMWFIVIGSLGIMYIGLGFAPLDEDWAIDLIFPFAFISYYMITWQKFKYLVLGFSKELESKIIGQHSNNSLKLIQIRRKRLTNDNSFLVAEDELLLTRYRSYLSKKIKYERREEGEKENMYFPILEEYPIKRESLYCEFGYYKSYIHIETILEIKDILHYPSEGKYVNRPLWRWFRNETFLGLAILAYKRHIMPKIYLCEVKASKDKPDVVFLTSYELALMEMIE